MSERSALIDADSRDVGEIRDGGGELASSDAKQLLVRVVVGSGRQRPVARRRGAPPPPPLGRHRAQSRRRPRRRRRPRSAACGRPTRVISRTTSVSSAESRSA